MGEIIENPELKERLLVFENRKEAGEALAESLDEYRELDARVFAIPAGGVPVGIELSESLGLMFDLVLVRKIHIPWNPEAGFGALTWDEDVYFNESLLDRLSISDEEIEEQIEKEKEVIGKRMELFRGDKSFPDLENETVILADDGLASGFTMLAAVKAVKKRDPSKTVVAVPTGSEGAVQRIEPLVDELFCLNIRTGARFAVAEAYEEWHDLSDEEVIEMLENIH